MQSLNGKMTGDSLTAAEWNQVPSELQNIIVGTGQTLSAADLDQLGKGVAGYVATSDVYISSGPADAYILSPISGFQGPTEYFDGMRVRFVPNVANAGGPVTVNVNGLGIRSVVREDGLGNTANSEYKTSVMVELRYDLSAGEFKLRRIQNAGESANEFGLVQRATQAAVNGGASSSTYVSPATLNGKTSTETRRGVAEIATQPETNAGTDDTRIVTPLKLETRLGLLGSDDITNDSTVAGATVTDALDTLESATQSGIINIIRNIDTSNFTTVNQPFFPNQTIQASTHYIVEGLLRINGVQTEGVVIEIAATGLGDVASFFTYSTNNTNPVSTNNRTDFSGIDVTIPSTEVSATGFIFIYIRGSFFAGVSPGDLTFNFRKIATVSQPITMDEGSWMRFTPATGLS